ncbi:uncharacterized protein B0H64DRAFT_392000 [Chaetomium fimeti]|uniref:Uncharacterized protein n=1 Tax=Chaetomium fimeti TaxID=1854472 RepID=A0AAE0HIY0_9PEZI|nr:hypothetical protein B0H64DRAFT_392000 [Chaetomium fimeti]
MVSGPQHLSLSLTARPTCVVLVHSFGSTMAACSHNTLLRSPKLRGAISSPVDGPSTATEHLPSCWDILGA